MEETISLNKKEQKRLLVLNQVIAGHVTAEGAAELLDLSERQVWRILAAYRKEGAAALVHGNRGRRPVNALEAGLRERVLELATTKYAGFNHQQLTEKLNDVEKIAVRRVSVRRILLEGGITTPRKHRPPKHRSRRERYPKEGMLIQVDGSRHDWLEGRGPYLSLLGAIDDATGRVVGALFREQEDAHGYFLLLQHIVLTKGCPLALYRDRHGIFEPLSKQGLSLEEQLAGRREPTQFGRLLEELEITSIGARSPQAKGRIERLWGTFQDRLVAELRLAQVESLEEANLFLPGFLADFNRRFAVPAAQTGSAYRPLPADFEPEAVFCFKYQRVVAADNTVKLGEHRLQLLRDRERESYARAHVEVQERLDGSLAIYYRGRQVGSKPAPAEAPVLRARKGRRVGTQTEGSLVSCKGAAAPDHPEAAPLVGQAAKAGWGAEGAPSQPATAHRRPAPNHPWYRPLKQGSRPQGQRACGSEE